MLSRPVLVSAIIGLVISLSSASADCPCANSSLCNNIQTVYDKELYGFIGGSNTTDYNWTYITAIAVSDKNVNKEDYETLMCTAHSHGARMILWNYKDSPMPFTNDTDKQMAWVKEVYAKVVNLSFDGYTFDFEGNMLWNQVNSSQYVSIVNLTTQYFHDNLPGSTVSVCVSYEAYWVHGRQYDYYNLALASDYLYIMDYDNNGQIYDSQCIARPNAAWYNMIRGITSYTNLGIPVSKLILGVPFYGYDYPCLVEEMDGGPTSKFCPIQPTDKNAEGVNCTEHAGSEMPFSGIMHYIFNRKYNITPIQWDDTVKAPFVNLIRDNITYQIWYDDAQSLTLKYEYAKSVGLRGVGPFQFGDINGPYYEQEMWSAFDAFFL